MDCMYPMSLLVLIACLFNIHLYQTAVGDTHVTSPVIWGANQSRFNFVDRLLLVKR